MEQEHNHVIVMRRKAVEQAVQRHNRLLVNWLRRKFNDADLAQDIAQSTYLRVLTYAETNDIDDVRALIFKTAANLAANEFRARRRASLVTDAAGDAMLEAVASDSPSPERSASAKQELEASIRAINGLPGRIRRAFILSRFMGMSYREIAIDLNVSESSVEKYIISALTQLRGAADRDNAGAEVISITEKITALRK